MAAMGPPRTTAEQCLIVLFAGREVAPSQMARLTSSIRSRATAETFSCPISGRM
ncbi:MAG: hypothetical protein HC850_02400 [Rhodomicrobium sp.]|nr:hypothetical protein [Rhodomicrobium sp.]